MSNVFLIGAFAFAAVVAVVVALHRVYSHSDELEVILSSVPVGVREESRCCDFSDGLGGPKRRRSHRSAVSMQRVNFMRPVERTGRRTAV